MMFKLSKSDQYIILMNEDGRICYVAISSCGHSSHELCGLYMYRGCKNDQVETDENGHLKILGVDEI
jgi:hypothetical protein